jgi:hypothetical protein
MEGKIGEKESGIFFVDGNLFNNGSAYGKTDSCIRESLYEKGKAQNPGFPALGFS